jgi:hypothetical protein
LSIARYPPPETAIPIFGTFDVLLETMSMYADALNPVMFRRVNRSLIGEIISRWRVSSHSDSFEERFRALRTEGLVEGQVTFAGAYSSGAFGRALGAVRGVALTAVAATRRRSTLIAMYLMLSAFERRFLAGWGGDRYLLFRRLPYKGPTIRDRAIGSTIF